MSRRYATAMAAVAALALFGAGSKLDAQIPPAQQAQQQQQQQQLQRMQEQVQRLDETMRRMTQIQQRAQEMEQLMLRDMEHLQSQQHLEHQEQIRMMAHSMAGAAGEMTQAMMGLREMVQSGSMDREMQQDMERLRQHMRETCDQMEDGLRIIQQLRDRLSQP